MKTGTFLLISRILQENLLIKQFGTVLNSETASKWQLRSFLFNYYDVINLFISFNIIFTQKNYHLFSLWSLLHSTSASAVIAVILTIRTSLSEDFLIQWTTTAIHCWETPCCVHVCREPSAALGIQLDLLVEDRISCKGATKAFLRWSTDIKL